MKQEPRQNDPWKVPPPMPIRSWDPPQEERRRQYLARYEELKHQGESFFPHTIFKDAVATLVIFLVLVALAVFVGAPLEDRADPTNTAYVPRPEWYFMFLFELLKYFPGELEWVGVALVPGLALLCLLLLPILDRGVTRHPRQRVLAVNLAALTVVAVAFLTLRAYDVTPTTMTAMITTPPSFGGTVRQEAPRPVLTSGQQTGQRLFQSENCQACHRLNGVGATVGPDLTHVGARRDLAWLHEYIQKPKDLNPAARMPAFTPALSHQEVEWLAQYLSTLR